MNISSVTWVASVANTAMPMAGKTQTSLPWPGTKRRPAISTENGQAAPVSADGICAAIASTGRRERRQSSRPLMRCLEKARVEFVAADLPHANRLAVGILALDAAEEARATSARTSLSGMCRLTMPPEPATNRSGPITA
jgi:hypothetical protein